ncbi:hypothetical protein scyTo_0004940 [Scyliorhinus torazame]|uniref:Uncharacterized protein n=1 Tax=Scyliorhinus torazame TaxID=75743 RepID=A0A401NZE9_SCYTO|nr:hypothetical protein [Scyliorhinus torazame]
MGIIEGDRVIKACSKKIDFSQETVPQSTGIHKMVFQSEWTDPLTLLRFHPEASRIKNVAKAATIQDAFQMLWQRLQWCEENGCNLT